MNRLDRLYARLDLNGRDGTPANSKVLYTFGVFAGWVTVGVWGTVLVLTKQPLTAAFVALVALVLAMSAGVDVFKVALKARLGGLGDAVREPARPTVMRAEPDRFKDDER